MCLLEFIRQKSGPILHSPECKSDFSYIHNSNQDGNLFGDLIKKTVESINQNVKYQMNLQHALIGAFKNNQNECQVCDVFCNEITNFLRASEIFEH